LEKENICETLGIGALLPAFCLHAVLATTMSHFSNVKVVYLSMLIFPHDLSFHSPILSLLEQLKICQMTEMEEQVREFSAKLALIPVPPPGQLHVVGSF